MPTERHFLGWDGPALPRAAAWLLERYDADMGNVVAALPAARAGRRLMELLAERLVGQPWVPPRIVTAGGLPETLYNAPDTITDELAAMLTRASALREAPTELLRQVVPHPPQHDDVLAWWRLAEQLSVLSVELASGRLGPQDVPTLAAELGVDLGLSAERWEAIAALEQRYRDLLAHPDRQEARRAALAEGRCGCEPHVVLVGMVDLSRLLTGMLEQCENVAALIAAPAEHAAGFDALGGLVVDYWREQPVEITDLRTVDRPGDQAIEVVRVLSELSDGTAADAVAVGLGDEASAGAVGRAIELAGTPARFAGGSPALRAAPAVLLDTLARYADQRRFADLAALVRHPDVAELIDPAEPWLDRLDAYATEFLQVDTRGEWRSDEDTRAALDTLRQRIEALLPEDHERRRPLPAWAEPTLAALRAVYGRRTLDPLHDHALAAVLPQITDVLRELSALDPEAATTPRVTWPEAVRVVLRRLAGCRVPEPAGGPAVELLGFLELPLNDAPFVVLTDLNEGRVPDSRNADAFLPDALRSVLGLADNARRYARDALLLNIVLRSRGGGAFGERGLSGGALPEGTLPGGAVVLTCRRSAEDEPLVPSRLLLACDEATRIERVKAFYLEESEEDTRPAPLLLTPGKVSRFLIPKPLLDEPALQRLRVTAFRDYLACRYRFYLTHVLRLRLINDRAVEMDALAYGSLAHSVLEAFGRSEVAQATDAALIEGFLSDRLDRVAGARFGREARPAVRVQVEQLRERLRRFADQQAAMARDGWRIRADLIEADRSATLIVDGEEFIVSGKVDRIDEHPELGFRLLDYKTSDGGTEPDKTHRRQGRWIDLQLPLYRTLMEPLGIEQAALGYINLPKSESKGLSLASWDAEALREAEAERDRVIRELRARVFWPPSEDVPTYTDAFTRVAADRALEREELIRLAETMLRMGGEA